MFRFISYPIIRAFTSIAIVAAILCSSLPATAAEGVAVGFQDMKGNTIFLHDFKGKVVVLNLWATWCAPCIAEMPSLVKLQQQYKYKGLVVIALSEDDKLADAINFFKSKSISALAPFFDKNHVDYLALKPRGLPTTLIVNRKGEAVKRIEGPVDWQSQIIQNYVARLIDEK